MPWEIGPYGVYIDDGASNNTIGGVTPDARNIISGNIDDGVFITGSGTTANVVEGNYIGTDITGTTTTGTGKCVGNDYGVMIASGASDNTIGGMGSRRRQRHQRQQRGRGGHHQHRR